MISSFVLSPGLASGQLGGWQAVCGSTPVSAPAEIRCRVLSCPRPRMAAGTLYQSQWRDSRNGLSGVVVDISADLQSANALLSSGQADRALAVLQHAIRQDPNHAGALLLASAASHKTGQYEQCIMYCKAALSIDSSTAEAWGNWVSSALRARSTVGVHAGILLHAAAAERTMRSRLNTSIIRRIRALHSQGDALKEQGDIAGAVRLYEHAVRLNPNLAAAHNNLGSCMLLVGPPAVDGPGFDRAAELPHAQPLHRITIHRMLQPPSPCLPCACAAAEPSLSPAPLWCRYPAQPDGGSGRPYQPGQCVPAARSVQKLACGWFESHIRHLLFATINLDPAPLLRRINIRNAADVTSHACSVITTHSLRRPPR